MLVGIHQPHYLPWLRYFEKIGRCDVFIVLDTVQFTKNGWQNRNKVKTAAGAALLTAPVLHRPGQRLDETRLNTRVRWGRKHLRTLTQAYAKAPYWSEHAAFFEQAYARDWECLSVLNRHMLGYFLDALGLTTPVVCASDLDAPGEATERLVNLVRAVDGTAYYTGAFALDTYLDRALFDAAGIELVVQHWQAPSYPQLHGDFIADLSIVDLLLNTGPDAAEILLGEAP